MAQTLCVIVGLTSRRRLGRDSRPRVAHAGLVRNDKPGPEATLAELGASLHRRADRSPRRLPRPGIPRVRPPARAADTAVGACWRAARSVTGRLDLRVARRLVHASALPGAFLALLAAARHPPALVRAGLRDPACMGPVHAIDRWMGERSAEGPRDRRDHRGGLGGRVLRSGEVATALRGGCGDGSRSRR